MDVYEILQDCTLVFDLIVIRMILIKLNDLVFQVRNRITFTKWVKK